MSDHRRRRPANARCVGILATSAAPTPRDTVVGQLGWALGAPTEERMFYLNRTGAPEGPFPEAQIIAMIQRGEVVQANICPVGQAQWQPDRLAPGFSRALSSAAARHRAPPPAQVP